MKINLNRSEIAKLEQSKDRVAELENAANKVAGRVNAPSRFRKYVRSGVGPQGPYAQVVVWGSGSIAWEYGGRNNPPAGQLRGAISRKV